MVPPTAEHLAAMPTLINLVATRCLDGDHAMMFRWYNDHVHLLMGCDALQEATLYRRSSPGQEGGPQYLCLYAFASHSDFMVFETSDARARAQAVVRAGWAGTGISILQRTQYRRLGRFSAQATDGDYRFASLTLGAGPAQDTVRWLNDRVHAAWGPVPGERSWLQAWGADDAGGEALVLGQGGDRHAVGQAIDAWPDEADDPALGSRPGSVALRWQADYSRLRRWER
jgi:hypothetical protein